MKESHKDYREYVNWYGKTANLIARGKSRMEYPLTIRKYRRQQRARLAKATEAKS